MKIIKKILSCIINPLNNLFKVEGTGNSSFFQKHQWLIGLLCLVTVAAIMAVVYILVV